MSPLLEGNTLGEKHKELNAKVIEVVNSGAKLDSLGNSDVEALIQIEVAAKCRNVEFLLEILKSEDMLYVSRAIKKSPWLVTEQQYAHIVNPQHLHTQLFPHMTTKAINKLLLHIRLNLKDEKRVNEFYKYYEEKNIKTALKWLPNCSTDVIDEAAKKYSQHLDKELFKRLCKRSFAVFENHNFSSHRIYNAYKDVMFLLNTHTEKFLDAMEKTHEYSWPKYGKKHTAVIMKTCPNRILDKFQKYANKIDMETFGKHLGSDNIKEFILKEVQTFPSFMLKYKNVKPLIKLMPKQDKFEFLKNFFINKNRKKEDPKDEVQVVQSEGMMFSSVRSIKKRCAYSRGGGNQASSKHIYDWYRHAPFEVALTELKGLIRAESSPEERGAIFRVLLTSAGQNMNNISTLIQYYNKNHINEPFKFKINFVNAVISTTQTHKYDEKTWTLLQELFHSMEVYIESDNNVQNCVSAIIVYNVVRKLPIPAIVGKKFTFTTLKSLQNKLTAEEKDSVFNFLYNFVENKLKTETSDDRDGFYKNVAHLEDMLNLLVDWNKDLKHFPNVLENIKKVVTIQHEREYDAYLDSIYYKKKNWSKYMIEESLLIARRPKVCMNLLKHNPRLLEKYESEVAKIRTDDKINLKCFLSKLRVYWPEAGGQWAKSYLGRLEQSSGQKATVRALCVLLPRDELKELLERYAPDEPKIVWGQMDNAVLGVRKQLSKQMYNARPHPSPHSVLLYARGDYLQFAMPSFNSIFYNMPSTKARECLPHLMNAVSLKKHGIRVAFSKLSFKEVQELSSEIWNSTSNASLRAVMFKETFDMLCREKNPQEIEDKWTMLEYFINKLGKEENKMIYVLLGRANEAPSVVLPRFYVMSYNLLNSLPPKMNCERIAEQVCAHMPGVMDKMDADFIANLILEFLSNWLGKKTILNKPCYGHPDVMLDLVCAYLLRTPSETEQLRRYERVFAVLVDLCIGMWTEGKEGRKVGEEYFVNCLNKLIEKVKEVVLDKQSVLPEAAFRKIVNELENKVCLEENYHTITMSKLMVLYVDCCKKNKSKIDLIEAEDKDTSDFVPYGRNSDKTNDVWSIICVDFGKACVEMLRGEIDKYYPSVRELFTNALRQFHNSVSYIGHTDVVFLRSLIEGHEYTPMYLTAIDLSHISYSINDDDPMKDKLKEYRAMILAHPSSEVKMHYYKK